jgi:enamine deaminase RidA (YjgF/YER057c/UK114 family)
MPIQRLNPSRRSAPNGFTHVVITEGRKLIFIAGQTGGPVAEGETPDLATQVAQTFENLKICLEEAGATFSDLVKFTTFVVNFKPEDRTVLAEVRRRYLKDDEWPANSLIGVQALANPSLLIEIEAIAVVG